MKKLILPIVVWLTSLCFAQEPPRPASEPTRITVELENSDFSPADLHIWITQEGKEFERHFSRYGFRIIHPLAYANREIDVYLPHRISGRERAVEDRERIVINVNEEEIVRLLKGTQKNGALVRSHHVETEVLAAVYAKLKKNR